jgi:hypothetical protein
VANRIAAGAGVARNKFWIRDRPVAARNKSSEDYKLSCKERTYHKTGESGTLEDLQKVMRL